MVLDCGQRQAGGNEGRLCAWGHILQKESIWKWERLSATVLFLLSIYSALKTKLCSNCARTSILIIPIHVWTGVVWSFTIHLMGMLSVCSKTLCPAKYGAQRRTPMVNAYNSFQTIDRWNSSDSWWFHLPWAQWPAMYTPHPTSDTSEKNPMSSHGASTMSRKGVATLVLSKSSSHILMSFFMSEVTFTWWCKGWIPFWASYILQIKGLPPGLALA